MLKPNNKEKPKVVNATPTNTVGRKPGGMPKPPKPQFTKATQALAPNQPFLNLVETFALFYS